MKNLVFHTAEQMAFLDKWIRKDYISIKQIKPLGGLYAKRHYEYDGSLSRAVRGGGNLYVGAFTLSVW